MEKENDKAVCGLCHQPMPEGEEMFQYHGYSSNCPSLPTMNEKELRDEEFSRLWASVSPLIEKMKAKYPKELNLDGLEPALTHDICMIVKELNERLKEKVVELYENNPQTTIDGRTGYRNALEQLLALIDNHA